MKARHEGLQSIKRTALRLLAIASIGLMLASPIPAQAAGLLKPQGGDPDDLIIKSHRVSVVINNGFAKTEVDQVFFNQGDTDQEAIYTFPIPRQASLSELSLWINGQEVIGEVLEKEKARQVYEDQKSKGNDTALAEKDDYKTFDVSVSPVRSQAETRVRLVYYQPLEIDLNIGRYVYPMAEGNVDDDRVAFWSVDDRVHSAFSFNLVLKSAFPVKEMRVPGFQNQAVISQNDDRNEENENGDIYHVNLDLAEGATLSRDIVVYYRLDDSVPARVELIPFREAGQRAGTFMLVVTPGGSIQRIAEGTDWTFVLDVSGSMGGHKIATLVDGVSRVLGKMSDQDRFRIITFNQHAQDFSGGYIQATPENLQNMIANVKKIQAGGSTALYAGLKMAYDGLDDDRITGIIIATDGVANVGPATHAELMDLHRQHDVRLFTFVIGNSANRPLLNNLAKDSGGFAMNISSSDDIVGRIIQAKAKVLHEALYDAKLTFQGERVHHITPTQTGNLYVGQQLVMFGQYHDPGDVDIEFSGRIAGREMSWRSQAHLPEEATDNPEIERLWALATIDETMDIIRDKGETAKRRQKIVDLGTRYSLVTDYTSMVVLDEAQMEGMGIDRSNAHRVEKERKAQHQRAQQAVQTHRVDRTSDGSGMFGNSTAPGIGTGPVGPLFIGLAYLLRRRKRKL